MRGHPIERAAFALAAAAALAACKDTTSGTTSLTGDGRLRVVNGAATAGAVQVYVNGQPLQSAVGVAQVSPVMALPAGSNTIEIRAGAATPAFARTVSFAAGDTVVVIALDSAGGVTQEVLSDTNAIVPVGATKLRVAHMAAGHDSIEIWRTQPDWQTPIRIMFPFNFRDVSPYLQSTPGDWRVLISSPIANVNDPIPDTLAMTQAIPVASGSSRTVVIVDAPGGGLALLVLDP